MARPGDEFNPRNPRFQTPAARAVRSLNEDVFLSDPARLEKIYMIYRDCADQVGAPRWHAPSLPGSARHSLHVRHSTHFCGCPMPAPRAYVRSTCFTPLPPLRCSLCLH